MTKVDSIERLINSAWQALSLGNASLAMQHAQQANAIDPSSAEVAHILGVLASRDGRPDIALPLLQKSIDAGVTAQKLRHITEALLVAGHAKAALSPITDALKNYPAEAETFGLLAAVQVALEQWSYALKSAKEAVNLSPHNPAWQGTLSFCLLMQQQWVEGFEAWSGRAEKFSSESRSPAFHLAKPCELWIKNEQGPGDTLFFARYAPYLNQLGYKLHLQTDKKTLPLLAQTQVFASVQDKFKAKPTDFWLSIGDLPLAAIQTACIPVQNALEIHADEKLKEKYRQELAKIGPAPYIAITWRGGPKGKKQRAGVRMFEKFVDPKELGELIKPIKATFISVQRVPDTAEYLALCKASGKKIADYSALNNNLPGMLALLDIVDDYIAVPNTNVHLRESLEKSTHVLLNRPYQDWRWLADGDKSPWYPNATIYRPSIEGEWQAAFNQLQTNLIKHHAQHDNSDKPLLAQNSNTEETLQQSKQAILDNIFKEKIAEGWEAIDHNDVATAIKMAQEVMTHSPQHPRAMHLLGWAALTDLKFEMAASILQNAAQLAPNDGIIWRDFLRSLIAIKKHDDVFKIAEQLLQNPDLRSKSSIYYARAALYLQLGNNEKALADYDACLAISPNYIDALGFSGMIRMKTGDVRRGFREYTARKEARYDGHVCPWLRGNVKGVKVLIRRHMGLGDELSYLRYLPWLEYAGVEVDYWAGAKLVPILARMGYCKQVISDKEALPESANYDLCFEINELPLAVEALGAPEIAPPLPIKPREDLIAKWKNWLEAQGPAPYIGFNWRAGAASQDTSIVFSKLAKAIDATPFANALGVVNATFISLQRNVTKLELDQFSRDLGAPIHDAAGLTDDLDDLLALLSLLDENIGVSNTNMHLRAGLGLGSKVLVQNPAGDWRWGSEGTHSIWFTQSKVYRQTLQDGSWNEALSMLSQDLTQQYGTKASSTTVQQHNSALNQQPKHTQRIIWVTAGEIQETPEGKTSNIGSTRNRVLAPAKGLESLGWQSEFVNEGFSEVMGGWGNVLPQHGDTVIISKVFTNHGARLAKDAKDRGAIVIVDFCDNFLNNPKRAPLQRQLASLADKIVCSENTISEAFNDYAHISTQVIPDMQLDQIDSSLINQWHTALSADVIKKTALPDSHDVYPTTLRILWLSAGEVTQHNGIISSNLASTRYRVLLPAANLGPYGWKSEIIKEAELLTFGWKNHQPTKGDTLVVSKIFDIRSLDLIKEAKNNGAIIVADYCDNHFERSDQMGLLQQGILDNADCIITSTPELAAYIQSQSTTPCTHVTDCFEGIKGKPNFKPKTPLKLMWFGGVANHDTLPDFLKKLAKFAEKTPIEIDLVTLHNNGDEAAKNATTTALKVNYIPWSLAQFNAKLQAIDMVVIPTIEADYKSGKSPNRVIEPLWAGKYVVAGHLPAYEPFAPFASIGNDLIAGIEWAINNPAQVIEKIKAGQAYIAANHTPKLIGEKWHEVLSNVKTTEPSQTIKTNQNAQFFDSDEVSRYFSLDGIKFNDVKDAFDKRYPINADFKPAKKIAVFTAIFGGYDAPPEIVNPDPNLDYILFADAEIKNIPSPWQLRRLPRIFADPQVDARRVKVLSHQFLPDYQASVWIDGNVSPKQLTAEYVNVTLQRNPIAVCRHQFRHCIYEESTQIVKTAKDAPAPVMRQMQFYQSIGFPQNQGLHATMFLIRDQRDSRVLKHNARWWELLIEYSKRDQLSFDFVRWEMQTPVLTLPFNCRENTLFQWGIDASRGHVGKIRRNDESLGRAYFKNEQVHANIGSNIDIAEPYKAGFDRWTKRFLLELFDLNSHLLASKQTLGTSMLSRESISSTPFSLPDPRNGVVYQLFQIAIAESSFTAVLGDESSHELLMVINNSAAVCGHIIFKRSEVNEICSKWFEHVHKSRYKKLPVPLIDEIKLDNFDTVVLSTNLELTLEEISTLILKANINTKFIVLGKNVANFELCVEQHNYEGFLHPFRDIKHNSIASYIKQLPVEQNDHSVDQQIYQKSVYGVWLKKRENDMTWQFAMRGNYGFYFARWIAALDKCVFLDIGANYGLYSILASQNNNIEAVHAFEPHPETFRYLTSNLSVNKSNKCNPHPFAIATVAGKQTIYADASHSGKATLRDNINPQNFSEHFDITTISNKELDELIKLKPSQNVVVKIDVEGYEIEVIKTLIKSKLWQQVSHIYCEVDTSYLDENELLNLMKAQGFKVIHQNGSGDHYDLMFGN